MFGILARLIEFLYSFWPSYGGAIILLTVVIMVALAPLTFKSTRSLLAMQALQPEMKKLQNRYKDDRQKLNEEMMAFYKENKISPLGGCLPMLIQFPVFIILYAVLLGLTQRGPFGGDLGFSTACSIDRVNQACTSVGTYANAGFFHPSYLEHSSKLYQNLSATRVMDSMGLDLSKSAWGMFSQGLVHALPYLVMVLVVMGLTFWQQQQIQNRQTNSAAQNASQQMMMKVMPVMMGVLYIAIPAGVVVYFLVSSLFRVGQQAMVTRTFYTGPNAIVIPPADVDDGKPAEKKNFWSQFKPSEASLPQVGKQAKAERAAAVRAGTAPRSKNGGSGGAGSKGAGTKTGAKSTGRDPKSAGSKPSKPKTDAKSSKSNSGSKSASKSTKQRPTTATEDRSKSTVKSESSTATSSPDDRSGSDSAPSRSAPSRSAPPKPGGSKKRGK